MNKTQFLYWLHKYFCGSCLHSLGLSYRSVWGSFRVCIEPWTVLGCFWSRYYRYPSFSSVSSFLSVFPDCHPNTPQCVVLAALIPCGRAGGSGEVMRVESVPHLRSCLREGTCLVLWAQPAGHPWLHLVLIMFCATLASYPKGDPSSKFTTGVDKSFFPKKSE